MTAARSSRSATNDLLAVLRAGRWQPDAWGRFVVRAVTRSGAQAGARPQAVAEITLLHGVLGLLGGRPALRWTAASWTLAVTHLGLLESRTSLGFADLLTLLRANLPALPVAHRPEVAVLALATDVVDGRIARRLGTATPFGRDADAIADAVFWTWFVARHEPSPVLRCLALAAWTVPAAAVAAFSVVRGGMVDAPRPGIARPAAALQILLAVRAVVIRRRV